MRKYFRLGSLILAAILIAAGCAPAAQPTPPPAEPTADVNEIVQETVVALQTQMSAEMTAQAPAATPTEVQAVDTPTEAAVPTFPPTPTSFVVVFPTTSSGGDSGGGGGGLPTDQPKYQCSLVSEKPTSGSSIEHKADFDAVWTVRNTGWKNWETSEVDFYYISGQKMQQGDDLFDLPSGVATGKTVKLTVDMVAPKNPGTYTTSWGLKVGSQSFCTFSLVINVH